MALDFPANPTNGQVYGNWIYNVDTDGGLPIPENAV